MTVLLMAEIEIEDEGFLTEESQSAINVLKDFGEYISRVSNLRLATLEEMKTNGWDKFLIPRLKAGLIGIGHLAIAKEE